MTTDNKIHPITFDLLEYEGKSVSKSVLAYLGQDELSEVIKILEPLVTITPDWNENDLNFKAGSNVGVIQTHGLRVQVRPSLSVRELVTLIRYALSGKIPPEHFRSFTEIDWNYGLEDALCLLLCDETAEIFRLGLSRRYEEHHEPLDFLRGRPLWEKNFPWRGAKAKELVCRYHQLTYDNLDNRLLLAGLRCALSLARSDQVKSHVRHHLKTLSDLSSEIMPEPAQFERAAQRYNRLTEHYLPAHGLCRLLLYGLRPESFYDKGAQLVPGVVLDMAQLFEDFVARFMEDILKPAGFNLLAQAPDRQALLDAEGQPYVGVRPDLIVWWGARKVCGVIDAKYKKYWETETGGFRPTRKIANEDLYQLFFYQQRLQRKYNLPKPPVAIIAAPLPEEDERKGPIISERYRRVVWQAGTEKAGDVRLVLIPMTKFLRLINQKVRPGEIISRIGFDNLPELFHGVNF